MSDMLEVLHRAEAALPKLIIDRDGWTGVFADTEKPHLYRLWRQWEDCRINLHFFDGIEPGDAAFSHPHPWPFAVRIHEGRYLMEVGRTRVLFDQPHGPPDLTTDILVRANLGPGDEYEMGHPEGVHAIRPLERVAKTVMVSGPPIWPQNRVKANKVVRGLTSVEKREMLAYFAGKYPYLGDDV